MTEKYKTFSNETDFANYLKELENKKNKFQKFLDKIYFWRIRNFITNFPRVVRNEAVCLFQRIIRGFDDRDTWDLDITVAKFMYPRLKRFKKVKNTYHSLEGCCIEEWDKKKELEAIKAWDKALDEMLWYLKETYTCEDERAIFDSYELGDTDNREKKSKELDEYYKKMKKAQQLLFDNWNHLGW